MHILFVAGIFDGDGVAVNGVGVVPLTGVCHVVGLFLPSAQCGLAAVEGIFNEECSFICLTDISLHVFIRVSVSVL